MADNNEGAVGKPVPAAKVAVQVEKAGAAATKAEAQRTKASVNAEIDRVKQSDLGKAEQKAAIGALKNVLAGLKG
jgi:hypothetical protein